ncbi:MAG: DUF1461 domain-containing protein [Anaerovoracaceae bacterium]
MKHKVFNIAAALIAAVCVICISVTAVVLARPLYYWDTDNLQIPETSGYSKEICIENYDALIDYNLIGGSEKLVFPSFSMSEQGEIHFAEVKEIFITMQVISIAGIILLPALCFTASCMECLEKELSGCALPASCCYPQLF